jgi:hypothetical protein
MRISNSFSEGEIQVLEFIVQTLLRGGSPTMATRHKEFASLCRKVMAMKAKVQEKNEKKGPATKNGASEAPEPADAVEVEADVSENEEIRADEPAASELVQVG